METLKTVVKYVLLPFTILLAIIFYLYEALQSTKTKLSQAKAEQELGKALEKFEEKKKDADAKEAAFNDRYNDFIKRKSDES